MNKAIVSLSLFFALVSADSSLFFSLEKQTAIAQKTLAVLPATCTLGTAEIIKEAQQKALELTANCSISTIIKNFAYIIIDAADFGSAAYSAGKEFVADIEECLQDDTILEKVECIADNLATTSEPIQSLIAAVKDFAGKLIEIIPEIKSEIKSCSEKSSEEYSLFLESVVGSAKKC